MEIKIYDYYAKEVAHVSPTYADAMKWIAAAAHKVNFGIYRCWTDEGYDMFDVGPRVYAIRSDLKPQNEKSSC